MDIDNLFFSGKFDDIIKEYAAKALGNEELIKKVEELKSDIAKCAEPIKMFGDGTFKSTFRKMVANATPDGRLDRNGVVAAIREKQPYRDEVDIHDLVSLFDDTWKLSKIFKEQEEKMKQQQSLKENKKIVFKEVLKETEDRVNNLKENVMTPRQEAHRAMLKRREKEGYSNDFINDEVMRAEKMQEQVMSHIKGLIAANVSSKEEVKEAWKNVYSALQEVIRKAAK